MPKLYKKQAKELLALVNSIPAPKPLDYDRAKVAAITCKTTKDFCDFLELDPISFKHWCVKYPEYEKAVMSWRTHATSEIEVAMAKRAIGFTKTTKRDVITKNGVETLSIETYYPPSETAGQFWLKNRKPEDWQDKKEIDVNVNANIRAWLVSAGGQLDPTETLDIGPGSDVANSLITNEFQSLNMGDPLNGDNSLIEQIIEHELADNTQADAEASLMAELEAEVAADATAELARVDTSSDEKVSPQNPAGSPVGGWSSFNSKWD